MGEHRSLTGEIDAETLACVESAITDRNADIWVFLEVSKRALQILEERIGLSCNHVDYLVPVLMGAVVLPYVARLKVFGVSPVRRTSPSSGLALYFR